MASRNWPKCVNVIAHSHDAWVVGSAASSAWDGRDIDILVPFASWHAAAGHVPATATPNTFGGWKWTDAETGIEVDMWPGDLSWLAQRPMFRSALHPASGARISKEPGDE